MSDPSSDEDFAAMFAQHEARRALEIGQMVKGRVIQISDEHVFVDVGGKGEAWIDRAELADDEGRLKVKVGDEIEATVVATGDEIRLWHRLRQGAQAREALAVAAQAGVPVEGKVAGVIKGGYEVTVGGMRAFCPLSQMELRRVESEQEYVGRVLEFRVTKYAEGGRNLVLSRRALLEEQAERAAVETRKKILPDAVLPGTVVSLADFGAFVDLGGVQGLVPVSELSHPRGGRAGGRRRDGLDGRRRRRADRHRRPRGAVRRLRAPRPRPDGARAQRRAGHGARHRSSPDVSRGQRDEGARAGPRGGRTAHSPVAREGAGARGAGRDPGLYQGCRQEGRLRDDARRLLEGPVIARGAAHHRSSATSAASSATVPRSENRIGSPTRMDSRNAGPAARKLVGLAGSSPRISSCVMTSSCG